MMENPNELPKEQIGMQPQSPDTISLDMIIATFKHALGIVKMNLPFASVVALILVAVEALSGVLGYKLGLGTLSGMGILLMFIITFLLAMVAYVLPFALAFLMAKYDISGRSVSENISACLNILSSKFVPLIVLGVLKFIIIAVGLVLFIVPGIVFALMLMFAEFIVISKDKGAVAAISESIDLTKGLKLNVFLAALILALILLIPVLIGHGLFGGFSQNIINGMAYDTIHMPAQIQIIMRLEEEQYVAPSLTPEQQKAVDSLKNALQQHQQKVDEKHDVQSSVDHKFKFGDEWKEKIYDPTIIEYVGSFVLDFLIKLISLSATLTLGLIYFRKVGMRQ